MKLKILNDYEAMSRAAADEILSLLQRKPDATLCLAAGETPRRAYAMLAESVRATGLDVSRCTFVALDEWIGIPPETEGSCHRYLKDHLFEPLHVDKRQIHMFDALSPELEGECRKMNAVIADKGGIDLMLVGVGMNGHVGFNEPGVAEDLYAHVVDLDVVTRNVGQKYFNETAPLQRGITLGLKHLRESRAVVMVASGKKKAEVMRLVFEEPVSTQVPASLIRKHAQATVLLDEDAASLLKSGMRLTGLKGQGGLL